MYIVCICVCICALRPCTYTFIHTQHLCRNCLYMQKLYLYMSCNDLHHCRVGPASFPPNCLITSVASGSELHLPPSPARLPTRRALPHALHGMAWPGGVSDPAPCMRCIRRARFPQTHVPFCRRNPPAFCLQSPRKRIGIGVFESFVNIFSRLPKKCGKVMGVETQCPGCHQIRGFSLICVLAPSKYEWGVGSTVPHSLLLSGLSFMCLFCGFPLRFWLNLLLSRAILSFF